MLSFAESGYPAFAKQTRGALLKSRGSLILGPGLARYQLTIFANSDVIDGYLEFCEQPMQLNEGSSALDDISVTDRPSARDSI
jgi:hypothetical protein